MEAPLNSLLNTVKTNKQTKNSGSEAVLAGDGEGSLALSASLAIFCFCLIPHQGTIR